MDGHADGHANSHEDGHGDSHEDDYENGHEAISIIFIDAVLLHGTCNITDKGGWSPLGNYVYAKKLEMA